MLLTVTEKESEKFEEMAEKDKERNELEMASHIATETGKGKKKKRTKDAEAPKRRRNAYIYFSKEHRPKVRESMPGSTFGGISRELAKRWKEAYPETKLKYENLAEEDELRYDKELLKYRAKKVNCPMFPKNPDTEENGEDPSNEIVVIYDEDDKESIEVYADDEEQKAHEEKTVETSSELKQTNEVARNVKPRGKTNAYAFFVQTSRKELKKRLRAAAFNFVEFSKLCSAFWKIISEEEKERFQEMAKRDEERYKNEMAIYCPTVKEKKEKKKRPKNPMAHKRPSCAFFYFCLDQGPQLKQAILSSGGDITIELADKWKAASPDTKQRYENLAKEDNSRYNKEKERYKSNKFSRKPGKKALSSAMYPVRKRRRHRQQQNSNSGDEDQETQVLQTHKNKPVKDPVSPSATEKVENNSWDGGCTS